MFVIPIAAACVLLVVQYFFWKKRSDRLERALESAKAQLERLQIAFQRFAPQAVVERIIDRGISDSGEKREVTVLFADIVGFTAMSQTMDPEVLVKILNGYFRSMSRAISDHRGHVSKFIGDGLLALFGAHEPNPWQCRDAVAAALAMRKALGGYNVDLRKDGFPDLTIGIGIHCGPVVAGVLGSDELAEFTVIGDVVNTASRIEGLTRIHRTDILVSRPLRDSLDESYVFQEMPPSEVKGKKESLITYALSDLANVNGK